jgi:preprotein translocase subunit SecA
MFLLLQTRHELIRVKKERYDEILRNSFDFEKKDFNSSLNFIFARLNDVKTIENNFLSLIISRIKIVYKITPRKAQLDAALAMCDNQIVDMSTGEGKTLTILIAAALKVLMKRKSVVVSTINSYLANRDYE